MILIGLRYTLVLCHSFKGCALPPFLPVSCSFPEPHPGPQGCLYNLLELALGGKYCVISNPLILPSTGHTGDRGDAQLQSGGPRRSSRLDLPRDLVLKRLSGLNLFRDPPVQGSQEVDMPRLAQGPNYQEANMPRPAQGFDLQDAVTPQPAWGSAP